MIRFFCDFDGTITDRDTIVFLTERFGAGPEFRRSVLEAIKGGSISVYEGIRRELATVNASWQEALDLLFSEVHVDPGFHPFVSWCREKGWPISVVSSGMRPVVEAFLGSLDLPIHAHGIRPDTAGWEYFQEPESDKQRILRSVPQSDFVVYIGDGTSDVAAVDLSDLLFAKERRFLASYCRERGLPYRPFRSFSEIRESLQLELEAGTFPPSSCSAKGRSSRRSRQGL